MKKQAKTITVERSANGKAASKKAAGERIAVKDAKPRGKEGKRSSRSPGKTAKPDAVRLLSGGNPQIAKGEGDGPVQAYIAAMPGWKREWGRRLDAIIERAAPGKPGLRKAVKWNSPFYGIRQGAGEAGEGSRESVGEWFMSFHCFAKYIKVAFFRGADLQPVPPGKSKQRDVRYLDIYEDGRVGGKGEGGVFDEAQFAEWVRQASRLPGEQM